MFSLDSPRYTIIRGIDALDGSGKIRRAASDVVFDTFVNNDPPVEFLRSQTRHCFIPGNIDHTVLATGTFG
jgi:hypothetical protein